MSELRTGTLEMPSSFLGPESPLPPLRSPDDKGWRSKWLAKLSPQDRKRIEYGSDVGVLPYCFQDNYDRHRHPKVFKTFVLENDILCATFLPEVGGRLWSLVHKPSGRELLYVNPVFQPVNVGIRRAWISGGVEWNMGLRGHSPHTISSVFAARIATDDGQPGLRLYEWERVRQAPYQLDVFLPDGSSFLFIRVRIVNPHDVEIPMYWWSNIAVAQSEDVRVLAPADTAYASYYGAGVSVSSDVVLPVLEGRDLSYPATVRGSSDLFYRIDSADRPWVTALDDQGRGLIQTSTSALTGRKLFRWGNSVGGQRWQDFLSIPGYPYIEIQAGLAATQLEYLPMAAGAKWDWLEAYGLMEADPEVVHGQDWSGAYNAVGGVLDRSLPPGKLDDLFAATKTLADRPCEEVLHHGSPWGALELRRLRKSDQQRSVPDCLVFDDDSLSDESAHWQALLDDGEMPYRSVTESPGAYMIQKEWRELLEAAINAGRGEHWLSLLHLGVMYYEDKNVESARKAWEKSVQLDPSVWALRNLAVLAGHQDRWDDSADLHLRAFRMKPQIRQLAIECCNALLQVGRPRDVLALIEEMDGSFRNSGRIRLMEARADLEIGNFQSVDKILRSDITVEDMRENETTLSDVWFNMHAKRIAAEENIPVDEKLMERVQKEYPPLPQFDFRMKG